MKKIFKILGVCAGLMSVPTLHAKVVLPEIIGDHMVLQQNTDVKLWGTAAAQKVVEITVSWNNQTYKVQSESDGSWIASIPTPQASYTPHTILFDDGEQTTIGNVLIGEVWFCSGQSNMEMPLNGFRNCPIEGANETIATAAQWKGIRMATIEKTGHLTPQQNCKGAWKESNPTNAPWFSATAFYFAQMLNRVLDVPVGIINCSWGGSKVEGWLPEEIVAGYPDVDLKKERIKPANGDWNWLTPTIMYNGMLYPLKNYTIKGFLWYQGESNVGRHATYAERLSTLVAHWRSLWQLGELPFYLVEIAPHDYGEGIAGALLREAQFKAAEIIPNSGIISTNDLVEDYELPNIHPKDKKEVGNRLAYMALNRTYGYRNIDCDGISFKSMNVEGNTATISFHGAEDGFNRMIGMEGFEIAGEDHLFYPAKAEIVNHTQIKLTSDSVKAPVAVRYCFRNFMPGNVADLRGLPLFPFRTDTWSE